MKSKIKSISDSNFLAQKKGSTLIELLIAATITVLVMTAIAISLMYSIQREAANRYQESAVLLAQNAIDMLLTERAELGWDSFKSKYVNAEYCLAKNANTNQDELILKGVTNCPDQKFGGLGFKAMIESDQVVDTQISTVITVTWNEGGQQGKQYVLNQDVYKGAY